jgi:hypothetical protein
MNREEFLTFMLNHIRSMSKQKINSLLCNSEKCYKYFRKNISSNCNMIFYHYFSDKMVDYKKNDFLGF